MQIARETRAVTQSGALSMVRDHAVADVRTARNQNKAAPSVRDSVDSVSFGRKHSQIRKKKQSHLGQSPDVQVLHTREAKDRLRRCLQ